MTEGYWRFCDMLKLTRIATQTITAPPQTERVVIEQHTENDEYRVRQLNTVLEEAEKNRWD